MSESNTSGSRELSVPFGKLLLSMMAMMFGFAGAEASAGALGGAASVVEAAQAFRNRRDARRLKRLELIVQELSRRLDGFMPVTSDERIDLFLEVIEKAIEDDEDRKLPFYSAVLDWMARKAPTPAQVRVLSDAVAQLSYVELFAFIHETRGRMARTILEADGVPEIAYVNRLQSTGLATGGVRYNGSPTGLGESLVSHVEVSNLVPPNKAAQQIR